MVSTISRDNTKDLKRYFFKLQRKKSATASVGEE
jgi:hypothetical protein